MQWGVPPDLPSKLDQLRALSLPATVDSVDWLPPSLRTLEISSTGVSNLGVLPKKLVALYAAYTPLCRVTHLPESLSELDLRWTQVAELPEMGAPPWTALQSLAVGGRRFRAPGRWPQSLETLLLVEVSLRDLRALPRGLRALHLQGRNIRSLGSIPEGVRILSLKNTAVVSLEGLPERLTTLRLEANRALRIDILPRFLERLDLIEPLEPLADLTLPRFLHSLAIEGFEQPPTAEELPAFPPRLESLALKGLTASTLEELDLPSSLRRLDLASYASPTLPLDLSDLTELALSGAELGSWPEFPPTLESLDLSGIRLSSPPRGICELRRPCELRHLKLQAVGFDPSSLLVDGLVSLDLSGVDQVPPLKTLPRSLRRLRLDSTQIEDLRGLPPKLEFLSIVGTPVRNLRGLPENLPLSELVVGAGQLESIAGLPPSVEKLVFE